jgi:hypothetical protein
MKAMIKTGGEDPNKKSTGGFHTRIIKRVKGKLEESPESSVSSTEIYASDNERGRKAKQGDGTYSGTAAPRVGGGVPIQKSGVPSGGTKKQIKSAKIRVKRNSALSPQAKRSALKLYR